MEKNLENFLNKRGVCYIPEEQDKEYSYQDYLEISHGNEKLARIIFDLSEWQHPETIFEELVREEEITEDGKILIQS